jgi:large subunit ribosomal protein L22
MESRAIARYQRIGPRKARLVVDMVRGKRVEDALGILDLTPKKAARIVAKTLRSAIANAEDTQHVDVDRLYIKTAYVDQGPSWSRWRARAQGRAAMIEKKSSHITLVLDER